jgi:hypothetical protein
VELSNAFKCQKFVTRQRKKTISFASNINATAASYEIIIIDCHKQGEEGRKHFD